MHYRYFIAESGPFVDRMKQFVEDRKHAIEQAKALADELGADYPAMTGRGIVGFVFLKNDPPVHLMLKTSGHTHDDKGSPLYRPDRRRKGGKDLAQRMSDIKMPSNEQAAVDVFGCGDQWITHPYAGRLALSSPACGFKDGVALAKVPVADKSDGMANPERENWEPPEVPGLREIKESEFLAAQGR